MRHVRRRRMLVAGIDSSTQSTKVVLCDAADGTVVGAGSAPHPAGTEVDPRAWWDALQKAGDGLLSRAAAVAVAGQQHGSVLLDIDDSIVRPALLWNDMRSAAAAAELVAEFGGPRWWADTTGSVPTASFTVTKLRWLAEHEPDNAARVARVLLPHDWLTMQLGASEPVTDRGDASGTGYLATAKGEWLPDVAAAGGGTRRGGRAHARWCRPRAGYRRQHGGRAWPGTGARRSGGICGHVRHGIRGDRHRRCRPFRCGGRLRQCDRQLPAAGVHHQRGPGAVSRSSHDGNGSGRAGRACSGRRVWRVRR